MSLRKAPSDEKGNWRGNKHCPLVNLPSVINRAHINRTQKTRAFMGNHRAGLFWTFHLIEIEFLPNPKTCHPGQRYQWCGCADWFTCFSAGNKTSFTYTLAQSQRRSHEHHFTEGMQVTFLPLKFANGRSCKLRNINKSLSPPQQFKWVESLPQRKDKVHTNSKVVYHEGYGACLRHHETTQLNFKLPLPGELRTHDFPDKLHLEENLCEQKPRESSMIQLSFGL